MRNITKMHNRLTGLAAYLLRDGLLDQAQAEEAIKNAKQQSLSFTNYLVKRNILSSQAILDSCVRNFNLPVFDLKLYNPRALQNSLIKPELISRYRVIPLQKDADFLHLGIADPTDESTISAISFHTGLRIRLVLIAEAELDAIIAKYFHSNIYSQLETAISKNILMEEPAATDEYNNQDDEPVIKYVDHLLEDAITKHVSDIHIEPYEKQCRIRFRRDGLLHEAAILPTHLSIRVITRLKIMGKLNIAERRMPQDGHIELRLRNKNDIRINTCPTLFGEKIVLRILNNDNLNFDIASLGFTAKQKELFLNKIRQPQGLILVTGPTGSGKTLTLYSALHYLNQTEKNISSVEDPIEIELMGINQINVNPKIGLDFAAVLRALLRQDPDIIMIGEIRDNETAKIAMQAAQTGHLVLSTLHTNSAVETITRLRAMGIVDYNFINAISLIIAQRLLRKLCNRCKQLDALSYNFKQHYIRKNTVYKAIGCDYCHQGYHGRVGVFECFPLIEKITQIILSGATISQIIDFVKSLNLELLWDAGMEKVRAGVTSVTELVRVLEPPESE